MAIPKTSLLYRALEAHAQVGYVVPSYGRQLERLGRWDDAGDQFDRLAETLEPRCRDEFASRLLSIVMFAALDAALVAPSRGTSTILERRAAITKRYAKLLAAVDALDLAFELPKVEVKVYASGELYHETSIELPGALPSEDSVLRSTVQAWRVALGDADPTLIDHGPLRAILYRTREAPAALLTMRAFLTSRKMAELEALHMGKPTRKTSGAAHVRTFVTLLDRRLRESFGFRDVKFLTVMANALFGQDDVGRVERKGSEFHEEGVRKILERASKRSRKA